MQGVIMAGGFGTRMHPLTCNIPKPMIPLANIPIIEHVIQLLKSHEIVDIVVLLYFQPEAITEYLGDGSRWGVSLHYIRPETDLGTVGAVKYAEHLLKERFLVISGDLITDFNLHKAIDFHDIVKAKTTILLTRVENPLSYGVVITHPDSRIKQFLEKPTWGQVFSDLINTGIYIIEPEVLKMIPPNTQFDFSNNLFPLMMANNEPLYGYHATGYWRDIGNLEEYLTAHKDFLKGIAHVTFPGKKHRKIWIGEETKIHRQAQFEGQVIVGKNCTIAPGATIINSSIGDGCTIDEGAYIADSILWQGVSVGIGAQLREDIIGFRSKIEDNVFLQEKVFIGDNCHIGENSRIQANVKIWPDKVIEKETTLSTSLVWGSRWERVLFFESKVSGLVNTEMSPEFSARLGTAFGAYLGVGSRFLASHDASNGARMVNRNMIGGLLSMGVNVDNVQVTPVPVLRTGLRGAHYKGGLHIRQSPKDPKCIDAIFFDSNGHDLPPNKAKAIERLFFVEDYMRAPYDRIGKVDYPARILENYRDYFLSALNHEAFNHRRLKIVIDYCWGGATSIFPTILGALGCDVISLNAYLDPRELTITPQEIETGIKHLSKIVTSLNADAGFMINQSAESIIVLDERGRTISNQQLLVLVTDLFLKTEHVSKIAVPVTATQLIEQVAKKYNVEVTRTMNSHRSMTEVALKEGIRFIGGTRGGFIFTDFFFACDAMFATAKILEMLASCSCTLGSLVKSYHLPAYSSSSISCPWELKGRVMRHLIHQTENMERQLVDGVKIFYPKGWVLVVPDQRSAAFLIMAEAPAKSTSEKWVQEWAAKVEKWKKVK